MKKIAHGWGAAVLLLVGGAAQAQEADPRNHPPAMAGPDTPLALTLGDLTAIAELARAQANAASANRKVRGDHGPAIARPY